MKKCSAASFVKAVAKCLIGASSHYRQQLTAAYIIVSVGLETRTKQRIKGKGVCVQCDFDIDCIQANNGYEHLKLSYHDGLCLFFLSLVSPRATKVCLQVTYCPLVHRKVIA